jgi:hypothetical protein
VGKPEGKRPLGRPRRRWVDNIKMDLRDNFVFFVFSTVTILFCSGTFSMVIQSQNASKDNNIYDLICVIRYHEN